MEVIRTIREKLEKVDKMENMLEQVTKLLAVNTNYAAMVTTPMYRSRKIKFIQLTEVDANQLLAIIVIEGNIVEVVYQPAHKQTTFTALEITTDDTFPRALGRWSNGEHNRFKIDIELLPNGKIAQHLPSQTVEFKHDFGY